MRIYAVADIHGKLENFSRIGAIIADRKVDLLVVAGDLTRYRGSRSIVAQLSRFPVPCLCIRGNTDRPAIEQWMDEFEDIHNLHLKKQIMDGIHFAGAGGTVPLPFRSRIRLRENVLLEKLAPLVTRETVLVAHPPPYGSLDRVLGRFHAGSRNLGRFLIERQPRLLICGHVHEDSGVAQVGNTLVANCAMSKACAGVLVELDEKHIRQAEIIKNR
jgi:Icc-related predicted phosphoesterase